MPRRAKAALAMLLAVFTLTLGGAGVAASTPPVAATAAAPAGLTSTTPEPPTTDNPFLPENANLTDCVSAVPRPGCGSEARGGWHQGLVFGVIVVALAFIGWRIVVTVRRSRRELESTGGR